MKKAECFKFTNWVADNYKKVGGGGYVKNGERITETSGVMRVDELYEIWKSHPKPAGAGWGE